MLYSIVPSMCLIVSTGKSGVCCESYVLMPLGQGYGVLQCKLVYWIQTKEHCPHVQRRFSFSRAVWRQAYAERSPENKKVLIYMNTKKKKSSTWKYLIKDMVHLRTLCSRFCNWKIMEKNIFLSFLEFNELYSQAETLNSNKIFLSFKILVSYLHNHVHLSNEKEQFDAEKKRAFLWALHSKFESWETWVA